MLLISLTILALVPQDFYDVGLSETVRGCTLAVFSPYCVFIQDLRPQVARESPVPIMPQGVTDSIMGQGSIAGPIMCIDQLPRLSVRGLCRLKREEIPKNAESA
jgi:hypothetical protein